MRKIYWTDTYTDENGVMWYNINGDTHYPLNEWTKGEAEADYLKPESEEERILSDMRAYGYFD